MDDKTNSEPTYGMYCIIQHTKCCSFNEVVVCTRIPVHVDTAPFRECTAEMVCSTTAVVCHHVVYPGTETESPATGRVLPSTERMCNKTVMVCPATERACYTSGTERVYPTAKTVCPDSERVYPTAKTVDSERVYPTIMIMPKQANVLQAEQPDYLCNTPSFHGTFNAADPGV